MFPLYTVRKDDVLDEAFKTQHYFAVRGILYDMEQEGLIHQDGTLYVNSLQRRAMARDCWDTVNDILCTLASTVQ